MGSLLYLLMKLSRGYDAFPYDSEVFCLLLAVEVPQYLRLWLYGRARR